MSVRNKGKIMRIGIKIRAFIASILVLKEFLEKLFNSREMMPDKNVENQNKEAIQILNI